jgi:hypothetical protein
MVTIVFDLYYIRIVPMGVFKMGVKIVSPCIPTIAILYYSSKSNSIRYRILITTITTTIDLCLIVLLYNRTGFVLMGSWANVRTCYC